ncbi:DcuS/MalK family sensor histidine kinase [Zophobihabitans entericus]|uniref:histidine kinase n=1 Tax=Zophobihabitans entericus TaxID=1635327 RepID=A0A6G9IAU2_9GAMM|nr:DcuS/MalK family sensor histidine kinase [Zophobihabitans entericus]QIQ21346.1 two-component system sensor histidine kinase DcuS [Zophobihabitans entericus]
MKKFLDNLKLKTKLIILICLVFILAVVAENIYIIRIVNNEYYEDASQRVENVASLVAVSPSVINNISHPTPENLSALQSYAEITRQLSQVEFITIFGMDGKRFTHPDVTKIGQMIVGGDGERALQGESYLSTAKGTLGVSIRSFHPIVNEQNQQIGAVMVGQTLQKIDHIASRTSQPILLTLVISLAIAISLALFLSRNIKNILLGFEPFEMVKLFEERDAIIRTVKEGIIVINREGLVTEINDEAKRILRTDSNHENIVNHNVSLIIPNSRLHEVMQTGKPEYDSEQNINGITILTNRTPLFVKGQLVGAVASFRDMTEVRQLAENLTGVNSYADALRSQSHEFNNKLHVIYGLAFNDNKDELINYIEEVIGSRQAEQDGISQSIKEPIIAGFLNSKFSRARELGVELHLNISGILQPIANSSVIHSLVTILGNLIDNGLDAVQFVDDKQITVNLSLTDKNFEIEVQDSGDGIEEQDLKKIFTKGYSTKGDNRGFGLYLVLASIDELGGFINICETKAQQGACFHVSLPLDELYQGNNHD